LRSWRKKRVTESLGLKYQTRNNEHKQRIVEWLLRRDYMHHVVYTANNIWFGYRNLDGCHRMLYFSASFDRRIRHPIASDRILMELAGFLSKDIGLFGIPYRIWVWEAKDYHYYDYSKRNHSCAYKKDTHILLCLNNLVSCWNGISCVPIAISFFRFEAGVVSFNINQ
jgi:hypothetical protein